MIAVGLLFEGQVMLERYDMSKEREERSFLMNFQMTMWQIWPPCFSDPSHQLVQTTRTLLVFV